MSHKDKGLDLPKRPVRTANRMAPTGKRSQNEAKTNPKRSQNEAKLTGLRGETNPADGDRRGEHPVLDQDPLPPASSALGVTELPVT